MVHVCARTVSRLFLVKTVKGVHAQLKGLEFWLKIKDKSLRSSCKEEGEGHMKSMKWMGSAFLVLVMVLGTLSLVAEARRERARRGPQVPLIEAEATRLQFMREEENMARLVYRQMYAIHGARIFGNIARSEERHALQVARKLAKYGVTDPSADNPDGVFDNADLQSLHDSLIASGGLSLSGALHAGALIEETDIADLEAAIGETTHADLARMYSNLLAASKNHLRAFVWQLETAGETYTPTVLTQEEFDAIVN